MIIVCKEKDGANIYSCEDVFSQKFEIGTIYYSTREFDDGENWICSFDTKGYFAHGDSLDDCIERFVNKIEKREEVELTDMSITEFVKSIEEGCVSW